MNDSPTDPHGHDTDPGLDPTTAPLTAVPGDEPTLHLPVGGPGGPYPPPTGGVPYETPTSAHPGQYLPPAQPGGTPGTAPFGAQRPPWEAPVAAPAAPRKSRKGLAAAAVVGVLLLATGAGAGGAALVNAANDNASGGERVVSTVADNGKPASSTGSVEGVAAAVLPSVVKIEVSSAQGGGSGSGIILSSDGEILTNHHVIQPAGADGSITLLFNDGTRAPAKVLGTDPLTDTALIKAEGVTGLTPATLGKSADLRVGQEVVAIGAPFGLNATVTSGIVSALNRPVNVGSDAEGNSTTYPAIQTDAAINPGNSGGPLVDMNGHVIGINSSIRTAGDAAGAAGSIGLGFAIPIDEVVPIVEQMRAGETPTHARLGIGVAPDCQPAASGVVGALVSQVTGGSTAARAGLREGDVITKVDDTLIEGADSLIATIRSHRPGEKVTIVWQRGGKEHRATLKLDSDEGTSTQRAPQQQAPNQQAPQQQPSEGTNPFEGFGD